MSDDDLLRFCAANDSLRVERDGSGDIVIMTPAGSETSRMNMRIGRLLDEWAETDGRGVTFDSNGGFKLPDGSVRAADAAWLRLACWEALSPAEQSHYAPVCPDFVIELRSPSDSLSRIEEKLTQWISNGVQLAWLIDPEQKSVTVYRPGQPTERHIDPDSMHGTGPVAGFELPFHRIWS